MLMLAASGSAVVLVAVGVGAGVGLLLGRRDGRKNDPAARRMRRAVGRLIVTRRRRAAMSPR
jgi:hypothetical protein